MSVQTLSYSRIKTFTNCSWLGYAKYILKVPDKSNLGAQLGTITHTVLECCADSRRKQLVERAYKEGSLSVVSLYKLISKSLKKIDALNEENLEKIEGFLHTAFSEDFYGEGCISALTEYKFDIHEEGRFKLTGFIDRLFLFESEIKLIDFKSSKQKMSKEEREFSIQALMYIYAANKLHPHIPIENISVNFMFLKFPDSPHIRLKFTSEQLKGFEEYMVYTSDHLSDFGLEKALADMAAEDPKRRWLCGRPGMTYKDTGELAFTCAYREPRLYFEASKDGDIKTADTKKELQEYECKGYQIISRRYGGCPKYWN